MHDCTPISQEAAGDLVRHWLHLESGVEMQTQAAWFGIPHPSAPKFMSTRNMLQTSTLTSQYHLPRCGVYSRAEHHCKRGQTCQEDHHSGPTPAPGWVSEPLLPLPTSRTEESIKIWERVWPGWSVPLAKWRVLEGMGRQGQSWF